MTSSEFERSISSMRRLNNYMRCTMGESRLSTLSLMYINYDMPVDLDEIVHVSRPLPEENATVKFALRIVL